MFAEIGTGRVNAAGAQGARIDPRGWSQVAPGRRGAA
jgi:hypothetical protein